MPGTSVPCLCRTSLLVKSSVIHAMSIKPAFQGPASRGSVPGGSANATARSIGHRKILELTGIFSPRLMNLCDPGRRGTLMAPLNHPSDTFLFAFKDCLDAPVPAVSNPPFQPEPQGCLPGVMPEENTLDPPFDRHVRPCLLHLDRTYHRRFLKSTMKSIGIGPKKESSFILENAKEDRLEFVFIPFPLDGFTE